MAKRDDSLPDFDSIEVDDFNPPTDRINVADWSAEDYSKFFVRYRPRLQAYAGTFLKDKTEADEVVLVGPPGASAATCSSGVGRSWAEARAASQR